ncbi:MAG: 16S rRNA (guanine966-N2)-methyltransferase [Lentimonas sp.]|jgi:16S rRNA (guanine966-N2)-methyltransferase
MRITGGKARGIQIKAPTGDTTRPATDRMREAIFSSLGPSVEGSRVADLFAGTGAYGLEALSRGAIKATFYEIDKQALACMKKNQQAVLKCCELPQSAVNTIARDLYGKTGGGERAELVFIDPPYDDIEANLPRIFEKANALGTPDARVILELPGNLNPEIEGWKLTRRFGKPKRDTPNAAIFERA